MPIPYGRQSIDQEDINAVVNVLKSDFLTQGPVVPRFEEAIAGYVGARFAVASNSATSSLHLACMALGVGQGDYVWTSPTTFVASANCALYCGAQVDFVDIDPISHNMSVVKLREKLEAAKTKNILPKAVIPVHLTGLPCEMEEIHALSREYGFRIIEDASHAVGAHYRDTRIGDCRFSDIAIFSFHPVKIITTGEGGIALTNDKELARKMELLRSHGVTREAHELENSSLGPWYYEQQQLGYNYRMIELEAALGLTQLQKLDSFIDRRQNIAAQYNEYLADLPLQLPMVPSHARSSFHLYVILLRTEKLSRSHRQIFEMMREAQIAVNQHYMPVYLQPYYKRLGFEPGLCPQAEDYAVRAISLPIYPDISDGDFKQVVSVLRQCLS